MTDRASPAVVTLRMTGALRAALHDAASDAGCSLNSYALQVLAAAAGDPARFRGNVAVIRRLDKEDPAFYVKWLEAQSAEAGE